VTESQRFGLRPDTTTRVTRSDDSFSEARVSGTGRPFKISTADGDIRRWSAIRWLPDIGRERPQRQPD
jgi:hypothetical protein